MFYRTKIFRDIVIIMIILLNLSGCYFYKIPSRDNQYLNINAAPALKAPAQITNEKLGDDYRIPDRQDSQVLAHPDNQKNALRLKTPPL